MRQTHGLYINKIAEWFPYGNTSIKKLQLVTAASLKKKRKEEKHHGTTNNNYTTLNPGGQVK